MIGLFIIGSYHSAMASQNITINNASIDLSKPISAALLAQYNRDGIEFDYDNTPVLKKVFVTDDNGAVAHQLPSSAARKVKNYTVGEKLEVIEDRDGWYAVRDKIYREYDEDGDGVIETNIIKWEKVFVKKDQTAAIRKTILTPDELNIATYLSVGEKDEYFETGKALSNYLNIELIDKALFEKKRPLAVDFLSKDRDIKKKNGVLTIPTTKKLVKFIDKGNGDDGDATFKYIGSIDFLNQHLVNGQYWEIADYKMIDKVTGETTQTFIEYPYISPDKKHIISAYANPYEDQHTDLELYRIQNKKVIPIMSAGFKNWMPATEPEDIFWARDGYLYLAVTHSFNFWKEDGRLNDKFRYIRIKVDL